MAEQRFRLDSRDEETFKFDAYLHAVTVIDSTHRLIHDGMVFHASGKVTGMIADNVDDILIAVPAGVFPHFQRLQITAGRGDLDIVVYEGTTTSADGSAIAALNINRNSSNVPSAVITSAPTVTDVGTLIHTQWIAPTATGVGQSPAGITGETNGEEWVLKPATKYLIRITNNSGATIAYRYEMLWYEASYTQ